MSAPTKIHLGTCSVHCSSFTYGSTVPNTFAALDALCTEETRFGYLNDGATITYSSEWFKAQDDTNTVSKSKLASQTVVAAGDLETFDGATLTKLIPTATTANGVTKVQGVDHATNTAYMWLFKQPDDMDGDLIVAIFGSNEGECAISMKNGEETKPAFSVNAQSMDTDGTIMVVAEETVSSGSNG